MTPPDRPSSGVIVHAFMPRDSEEVVVEEFGLSVFAWALLGFANVYYGIAQRARDLIAQCLQNKTSACRSGR